MEPSAIDGLRWAAVLGWCNMRPEDVLGLLRARPLVPLRVHPTDAREYDIRHPDQAIVLRSRLVIGVGADGGIRERLEHVGFLDAIRVQQTPVQLG